MKFGIKTKKATINFLVFFLHWVESLNGIIDDENKCFNFELEVGFPASHPFAWDNMQNLVKSEY